MRNRKNANPNAVGPTGRHVVQEYGTVKKEGLSLKHSGVGPIIADVEYDSENQVLEVTHVSTTDVHTREGLRKCTVMHNVTPVLLSKGSTVIGPEEWFPLNSGKTALDPAKSPLLPDDFTHEDGFADNQPWVSNLPDGMAWVRLVSGSSPIGGAAWDADEDDHSILAKPPEGRGPSLMACTIESSVTISPSEKKSRITLWFDQTIDQDQNYNYSERRKIRLISDKANLKVEKPLTRHPEHTNAIQFFVDRTVSLDEDIYVRIKRGLVKGEKSVYSRHSPAVSCNILADKNCYVLCLYTRGQTETSAILKANTTALIGAPFQVLDTQAQASNPEELQVPYTVYGLAPTSASSGGSQSYGVVWGGRGSGGFFPYIDYRNYAQWSLVNFQQVNVVDDWSKYILPASWNGSTEPAFNFPRGLGYVRLLPFSPDIGPHSWVDESFTARTEAIDAPPTLEDARIIDNTMYLTFNQPVFTVIPHVFPIITSDIGGPITSSFGVTEFDNILSYALSRSVTPDEQLSMTAAAEMVEAAHDSAYKSGALASPIRNISQVNAMVLVCNRIINGNYYRGQVVKLQDNGFDLADSNGDVQRVYDIIPADNMIPEHHHSGEYDGGHAISHAWSGS